MTCFVLHFILQHLHNIIFAFELERFLILLWCSIKFIFGSLPAVVEFSLWKIIVFRVLRVCFTSVAVENRILIVVNVRLTSVALLPANTASFYQRLVTDSSAARLTSREVKVLDLDLTNREVFASYFISAVFDEFVRLIEHHFRNLKLLVLIKIIFDYINAWFKIKIC